MKIVAGMGSVADYELLVKAGADEIFCGFVPYEWNERFGTILPLNRREVLFYHVQISSINDMKILRNKIKKYKIPVTVTFNSLYYTNEQLVMITNIINQLISIGFKDFIVADIGLALYLADKNIDCRLHISGELGEFNRNTIKFINTHLSEAERKAEETGISECTSVQKYGIKEEETDKLECASGQKYGTMVKRIIFHRKNTIKDMEACVTAGDYEYEAFLMNENCHFTGGFCNSMHCDELVHMCQIPYELVPTDNMGNNRFPEVLGLWKSEEYEDTEYTVQNYGKNNTEENNNRHAEDDEYYIPGETGCGLCALWKLKEAGITHLKIVGRGRSAECMKHDIKAARLAAVLLEKAVSEEEFRELVRRSIFQYGCSGECYYRQI